MGVDYYFYAEIKINNKWVSLNPLFKNSAGEISIIPIDHGRSYLREAYKKLQESMNIKGLPLDISDELKNKLNISVNEDVDSSKLIYKNFEYCAFAVDYSDAVLSSLVSGKNSRYAGYILKTELADAEIDGCYEFDKWLTANMP